MNPTANEVSAPPPIPGPPPTPKKPRVWPTILVMLGSLPCIWIAQGLWAFIAIGLFTDEGIPKTAEQFTAALPSLAKKPVGLVSLLLPGQILLLFLSIFPATFASRPLPRLGLRRWRIPTATVACLVLATPLCQVAAFLLVAGFGLEDSPQLEFLTGLITAQRGLGLVLMLFFFTLGAGVTEELLFRGYVQTRLAQRWPAWLAVLVSALCFAAMHGDPAHALGVFPLGLWFGFLALVSGSVLPAIAAHVLNNAVGIGFLLGAGGGESLEEFGLAYLALLGASALFLGLGLFRLRKARPAE